MVESAARSNDPPDWSMVPFPVACPRCGCDVHGRLEPDCPECALPLEWSVLAPVEELTCSNCGYHLFGLTNERCPECGDEFSWEDVIEGFRRLQKPLFEFHWRSAPLRWFIRAVRLAFRPRKLWQTIDIYDPTAMVGLIVLAVFAMLLSVVVPLLLVFPTGTLLEWLAEIGGQQYWRRLSWRYRPTAYYWQFALVLRTALMGATVSLAWLLGAFGGLMVLRQSMALCRVRSGHVFRVCVYSLIPLACCPAIACALAAAIGTTLGVLAIDPAGSPLKDAIGYILNSIGLRYGLPILVLMLLALCTVSMAMGYRHYIRMRHSWGVALSAQAIGGVTAFIVYLQVMRLF